MRIILWAPFGAGTHYWGPGTSAFRLYKALEDKNIQITLVHASPEQGVFPNIFSDQICIATLKKDSKLSSVIFILKSFLWISKNYKNYDAFHGITAFYYTFLPAVYFNMLRGKTFIKITGGNGGFGNNSKISRLTGVSKFRLKYGNSLSGYISISSFITNNLIENGIHKNKVFNLANGVNTDRFTPASKEDKSCLRHKNEIPDKLTFSYIGGLTENKRVTNILKSVKILKSEGFTDFQFLIVGPDRSNGVVESNIKKLIDILEIEDMVIRIPFTKTPEKYFNMSDVFILVSRSEGMSNSLLEAMSSGLPAIVTKISGSEDLIKENVNGYFTNGSPEDIARCLKVFINEKDTIENMGFITREIISSNYSNENILKKHIRLFKDVN